MIHRGRARRTISAGSWFGQWSPDPPVLCDRSSPSPQPLRSRGDLRSAEWRVQEILAERVPDRRRVTWKTSGRPNGGVGKPFPNQRNKSERKGNMRQPQLCGMPASGRSRPDRLLIFDGARGYPTEESSKNPRAVLGNSMNITRRVRRDVGRSRPGRINEQMRRRSVNLGATKALHEGQIVARKSSQEPSYVRVRRRAPGITRAKAACPPRTERE